MPNFKPTPLIILLRNISNIKISLQLRKRERLTKQDLNDNEQLYKYQMCVEVFQMLTKVTIIFDNWKYAYQYQNLIARDIYMYAHVTAHILNKQ